MLDAKFGKGSMFGEAIKRLGLSTVENAIIKFTSLHTCKIAFWMNFPKNFFEKLYFPEITCFVCWEKLKVCRKHRKKSWLAIFQADRKTKIDE